AIDRGAPTGPTLNTNHSYFRITLVECQLAEAAPLCEPVEAHRSRAARQVFGAEPPRVLSAAKHLEDGRKRDLPGSGLVSTRCVRELHVADERQQARQLDAWRQPHAYDVIEVELQENAACAAPHD